MWLNVHSHCLTADYAPLIRVAACWLRSGEKPTEQAWSVCATLFALTLVSPFFRLELLWLVLPFLMVIPFCLEDCYEVNGRSQNLGSPGMTITTLTTTGPQVLPVQAQPVLVQAHPVMAQAVPMEAHPVATVVATVANPLAGGQPQPQPQPQPQQQQQQPQQSLSPQTPPQAPSQAPPQYATASASFEVEAGGYSRGGLGLHEFLVECQLTGYELAMQEMGALEAGDLRDITEDELLAMGMKKLEVRRLQRSLASLG